MIAINVDGLDELIKAFDKLPEELEQELQKSLDDCAENTLQKALTKVPVKTGELKKSLKRQRTKKNKKELIYSAVTFTNKKGIPLELGHRLVSHGKTVGTVSERPFLRPSFDETKDENEKKIVDAFNRAIDKMGGIK